MKKHISKTLVIGLVTMAVGFAPIVSQAFYASFGGSFGDGYGGYNGYRSGYSNNYYGRGGYVGGWDSVGLGNYYTPNYYSNNYNSYNYYPSQRNYNSYRNTPVYNRGYYTNTFNYYPSWY